MDILNQLSNHLITEVCHKMSALLVFFAIKFLPSATALMAPTNEKRTEVNWIVNDGFVPNDGQMMYSRLYKVVQRREVVQMEPVHRVITGPPVSEDLAVHSQYHTCVANYDWVSAKHYSSQYINVVHLNFIILLSCLEHIRALTMNVYI